MRIRGDVFWSWADPRCTIEVMTKSSRVAS